MALFQLLFSWLGRSAGKILNAIFGWAVVALFGRTSPRQQRVLSGVIAMAAIWPWLVIGIVAPKAAAFLIAFVPLAKSVPSGIVRVIWIALTLAVPVMVGLVIASKAAPAIQREPFAKRVLRGFPVTMALAVAFLVMFVTVPLLRVSSALRRWSDEHVPLITEGDEYEEVASEIDRQLVRHGLGASRARSPWWLVVPGAVLTKLGGKAFEGFLPEQLVYWSGAQLRLALYPSDLLVRGPKKKAAWTHGLIAEALARGPGFETSEPESQAIERQIHRVWGVYEAEPEAHVRSRVLHARLGEITKALGTVGVAYDDWQILYRKIAQLARALDGQPQLLASLARKEGRPTTARTRSRLAPRSKPAVRRRPNGKKPSAQEVEGELETIRDGMDRVVGELDHRRHRWTGWRSRVRRLLGSRQS